MLRSKRRTVASLALAALFCVPSGVANAEAVVAATTETATFGVEGPAQLTETQMSVEPGASFYTMTADGEVFGSSEVLQGPAPDVSTYGMNPIAYTACWVFNQEDFPVGTYTYYAPSTTMTIYMQCGYGVGGHGYKHIELEHRSQWENRIIQVDGNPNDWDVLMDWVNMTVLGWAMVDRPDGGAKRCTSAPVLMYDADGNWVYTMNPTVIVATDTQRLITSFPSTTHQCK